MLECLRRPPGGSQSHPKSNAEESCELFPHGFSVCPLNTKNSKSTQLFTILLGRAMLECLRRATEGPQSHPKLPQGAPSHTKPAPSHPNGAPSHPKGIPSHSDDAASHPKGIDCGKNSPQRPPKGIPFLPRSLQKLFMSSQGHPKGAPRHSKGVPGLPKSPQRRSKAPQATPKAPQVTPTAPQVTQQASQTTSKALPCIPKTSIAEQGAGGGPLCGFNIEL